MRQFICFLAVAVLSFNCSSIVSPHAINENDVLFFADSDLVDQYFGDQTVSDSKEKVDKQDFWRGDNVVSEVEKFDYAPGQEVQKDLEKLTDGSLDYVSLLDVQNKTDFFLGQELQEDILVKTDFFLGQELQQDLEQKTDVAMGNELLDVPVKTDFALGQELKEDWYVPDDILQGNETNRYDQQGDLISDFLPGSEAQFDIPVAFTDIGNEASDLPESDIEPDSEPEPQILIASYPFEGNSYDVSGNNHHATAYGVTYSQGKVGQAAQLVSTEQDHMEIENSGAFQFTDASRDKRFSICEWVKMSRVYQFPIISKGTLDGATAEYRFGVESDFKIKLFLYHSADEYIGRAYSQSINDLAEAWQFVCATYDGSQTRSGIKIYINGQRVDDEDLGTGETYSGMVPSDDSVFFGRYQDQYAFGLVDELNIYGNVLSGDEINQMYLDATTCIEDADCERGSYCDLTLTCVNGCLSDFDCGPMQVCQDFHRCIDSICEITLAYDGPTSTVDVMVYLLDEVSGALVSPLSEYDVRMIYLDEWSVMEMDLPYLSPPQMYDFSFQMGASERFQGLIYAQDYWASSPFNLASCVIDHRELYTTFDNEQGLYKLYFRPMDIVGR